MEDSRPRAEVLQQASGFLHQQTAEGALTGRPVQQQNARLMDGGLFDAELVCRGEINQFGFELGDRVIKHSLCPSQWRSWSHRTSGVSTNGPITVAKATGEAKPKVAIATAIASSKLLLAAVNASAVVRG